MTDLGQLIFEQAALTAEAQRISLKMGRSQMASEVIGWFNQRRNRAMRGDGIASLDELIALCEKELLP